MDPYHSYYQGYVVTGVYSTRRVLDIAVQMLRLDGFPADVIATLGPSHDGIRINVNYSNDTKAPEGVAYGGTLGLFVGGLIGYLKPPLMGAWENLRELGQLSSSVAILAGAGAGALFGMISGGVLGMVLPEHTVHITDTPRGSGSFLLSVHCQDSDWCDKAEDIFEQTGAKEIGTTTSREYVDKGALPLLGRLG
jgi:hypothetical protein